MTFVPTPNVAKVAIVATDGPSPVVNTLMFQKASPYSASDLTALLGIVQAQWIAQVCPLLITDYIGLRLEGYAQDSDSAPSVTIAADPSFHGAGTPISKLPANVAMAVTHRTAFRGRSGRGRTFMGGFGADDVNDSRHWKAASVTAMDGAWVSMRAGFNAAGHTFVVVSYHHNKVALTAGNPQTVVSSDTDARIDTMRRRLG